MTDYPKFGSREHLTEFWENCFRFTIPYASLDQLVDSVSKEPAYSLERFLNQYNVPPRAIAANFDPKTWKHLDVPGLFGALDIIGEDLDKYAVPGSTPTGDYNPMIWVVGHIYSELADRWQADPSQFTPEQASKVIVMVAIG